MRWLRGTPEFCKLNHYSKPCVRLDNCHKTSDAGGREGGKEGEREKEKERGREGEVERVTADF